jgi:hypothetical protein
MPHVILKLLARKNRVHETPGMKKQKGGQAKGDMPYV